ncbi:hypothetical protein OFM21_34570, partial [Escherichia coli]|nr:hypothetical protein [Escherichia coli]
SKCWPLYLGWTVTGSSGYWTVHFSLGISSSVRFIPLIIATVDSITSENIDIVKLTNYENPHE